MASNTLSPRQKKVAIIVACIVFVYLVFGFLITPFILRRVLGKNVSEAINRQVTVGTVRVNPLTLSVTLGDFSIKEKDGTRFVSLGEAYANVQMSSIFKKAVVLKKIRVVNPDVLLVKNEDGTFNFSDMAQGGEPQPEEEEKSAGIGVIIEDLSIEDGNVTFNDHGVSVTHEVEGLDLGLQYFSTRPKDADDLAIARLSARVNGADLTLKAKTRPFRADRETHASLQLTGVSVPHYLPYASLSKNLVIKSFNLATENEIDFRMLDDGKPELVVAGKTDFTDLQTTDAAGAPFVNHSRLSLELLPSKVLVGEIRLARVESVKSEYFLKRLPTGDLYLPFLAERAYERAEDKAEADETGSFQPVVTIDAVSLSRATIHFEDQANREPFSTTLAPFDLSVDNFGLGVDRTAKYKLSFTTDAKETLALEGTACLSPFLQVDGKISLKDFQVPRYTPYFEDPFGFKTASGKVALDGAYHFKQEENASEISLSGLHLKAEDFDLQDKATQDSVVSLGRLEVADAAIDLPGRTIDLGSFELDGVKLFCKREQDGALNLVNVFVPAAEEATPEADGEAPEPAVEQAEPETESASFVVNLRKVGFSDVTVDVTDLVPKEPVHLSIHDLSLSASDLSTAAGQKGKADLSFKWAEKGKLRTHGDVTIDPLALDLKLDINALDVRPFQPYISENTGVVVTKGLFETDGRFQLSPQESGDSPAIVYSGDVKLGQFASIDRKNGNDFLKWKGLGIEDLKVNVTPFDLSVDQIHLDEFFARVIVDSQGSVNLVTMFSNPDEASTDKAPADEKNKAPQKENAEKSDTNLRIDKILLSGGDIDFSDFYIKPNYRARFKKLEGQVTGLASIEEKKADVKLDGLWGDHAPVKIRGKINPLTDNPFVDMDLSISDIELSPFSPYSGKYVGYILDKGKLTFNVDYFLENRMLEGKNSVYISQLTFGDEVDSPDAVKLPIKMAVALLKDRDGNIKLDLPVSGNLDDPKFKIGKTILTVLKNLIVKIVSSPFAALGKLVPGGGEELSYLEFDAGQSLLGDENTQKLDKLAKILYERPALKLDIQGGVAPRSDKASLQAMLLENRFKTQKLNQMVSAGKSAMPIEQITLSAEERKQFLEAAFAAADITAPIDESGKPVTLTPEVMEKLLREQIVVTDDQYRELANARAFAAKNYLIDHGQMTRDRLFIVEPDVDAVPEDQDTEPAGRVIFNLK